MGYLYVCVCQDVQTLHVCIGICQVPRKHFGRRAQTFDFYAQLSLRIQGNLRTDGIVWSSS